MVNKDSTEKESGEKKRRKTSATEGSTLKLHKEDKYESIIRHEEEEAKTRKPEEDIFLFHETCGELKKIFDEIANLKKDDSEKAKSEILEQRIQGSLIFVLLKKLNRLDKIRLRAGRDALHKEKLRVDSNRLQLQNLLYELNHLKREVERCYQFKSQDEEIELVTEEEFYCNAPESVSRPTKTKNNKHAKRLARLEWELQQRKELSSLVKELTVSKENVSKDITSKAERLNSLAPCLEALLQATRPLQKALDMEIEKEWEVQKSARLLPRPLYLAYVNLSAYSEACDTLLKVTIEGDEDEIRQMEEDEKDSEMLEEITHADDENQESDADETEAVEGNQRKTHNKRKSIIDTKLIKRRNLLKPHPLNIIVMFGKKTFKGNFSITFNYFPNLGFVSACSKVEIDNSGTAAGDVISPENILNNLYPDDFGEGSPNPKTKYQLSEFELDEKTLMDNLKEKNFGKPYMWVQRLCGIEFPILKPSRSNEPSTSNAHHSFFNLIDISYELSQNSVPATVKIIRSRWSSRLNLFKQIHALENKNIEPIVPITHDDSDENDDSNCTPLRISSSLVQWTCITWNEYSGNPLTSKLIDLDMVNLHDLFYRAIITRNSAKLECLICVSSNFPSSAPIWLLCLSWNGKHDSRNNPAVREMEMWTNSIELKTKKYNCILSAQLKRTMSSLDIFLETEGPLYSPAEFVQDKTFLHPFRGRTRTRPYKSVQVGNNIVFKQI